MGRGTIEPPDAANLLEFRHIPEGQAATLAAKRASDAAHNVLIGRLTTSLLRVIHGDISRSVAAAPCGAWASPPERFNRDQRG